MNITKFKEYIIGEFYIEEVVIKHVVYNLMCEDTGNITGTIKVESATYPDIHYLFPVSIDRHDYRLSDIKSLIQDIIAHDHAVLAPIQRKCGDIE